jgi:protocatechuate 3,4-dioxygenase beta subunit
MNATRRIFLVSAAAVLLGVHTNAQMLSRAMVQKATDVGTNDSAHELKCSGTVTDAAGHPLAGATVEYWSYEGNSFMAHAPTARKQIITEGNGAFEFQVSRAVGVLLAHKPGLAPGWANLNELGIDAGTDEHLVLTSPGTLAGVVVDEADKPVANADVFAAIAMYANPSEDGALRANYFFLGKLARDTFAARTDAAGRFRIENFPTNATAVLTAEAAGKAQKGQEQMFDESGSLPWHPGQEDIKLVMGSAGGIEGKIVVEGGNQPPPLTKLTVQRDGPQGSIGMYTREPAPSGADGAFQFKDLAAGSYRINANFGVNGVSDWVAEAVPVSVEAGQIARGITVTASRGGILEAVVLGQDDRKPLADVMVNAYRYSYQSAAKSDSNGIALLRLPPGDYQLMTPSQAGTSASVEAGKTNRVEIEVAAPKKITGIVRRPDGQPAAGLPVQLVGVFAPSRTTMRTDAAGKFELENYQPQMIGQRNTPCILIRDVEHNLAAAQDLDEDSGPLDLKLVPGLTLAGRAECDGKPVTNATATVIFWTGNSGMHMGGLSRSTNAPGRFEIPALPPARKYGVSVSAPGYGSVMRNDVSASAEPIRMELDPFELKPANLKLAGQVLDADDKPVARINVMLYGEGQPNGNTSTDREGRFRFERVCEGTVNLQANGGGSFGAISAEGGDTNVVLRLGQQQMRTSMPGSTAHKLQGTVTDAEGKPVAGAELAVFPSSFGNPQWTKAGTNGAYHLTWEIQQWQMQQSGGGGILVVRFPARNLAGIEDVPEDTTNLDVKLKAAMTVAGLVSNPDDSPLAGAQVSVMLKAGNTYGQLGEQQFTCDAHGRYEVKCLPADGQYLVSASAKGHGQIQQQFQGDPETNRTELAPFVLQLANCVLAGQVLNENDKPVSGAMVQITGNGQPSENVTTDSKGRFHFQVCEGQVQLFANSPQGGGFAQARAEAGDTNVVLTLGSQGRIQQSPPRAALKGSPLPDLAGVNLAGDAAPASQALLLCLFDAGQRSSRHLVQQLNQQAAALRQQNVTVLGVQAAVTTDQILNDWKTASPVSFPLGRVTEKSEKTKWASDAPGLPWLILTDAAHRVIAEGFPLEELDAQVKKLAK